MIIGSEIHDIYISEPESSPHGSWLRKKNRQTGKRTWRQ